MDYTDTETIREYLETHLTQKRYKHSLGVAKMAESLARSYDVDPQKAYFAALSHDIAKCYKTEQLNRLIREYGISPFYINNQALAHSKVGAAILKQDFSVEDTDVLNAVANHTTGRYGMSMLEEIVYVSDAIEQNRVYEGVNRLRMHAKFDIDAVCLEILEYCINNIKYMGKELDDDTSDAKRFIEEKLGRE